MLIRRETPSDIDTIAAVTIAAFRTLAISQHTEQFIINALRRAGALTLSLVAAMHEQVVGHVAFSPVTIADGSQHWYGLGPISVLPDYQKQGIGKALIQTGLAELKQLGAQGCCLVGDPNYYTRFGFQNYPDLVHEDVPASVFLALPFTEAVPKGIVTFHEGFGAND